MSYKLYFQTSQINFWFPTFVHHPNRAKKKMCNKTIWSLIFGISCFQFSYLEMKSHISDEGVTEREIAPNTGANATKFFTLATKSWKSRQIGD